MRIYKKSGSKERIFEMFENVNKIKLKESNQKINEAKFFDYALEGSEATEENAINAAQGLDWQSIETQEGNYPHLKYVDTINGVGIHYNYGSDSYYFSDESMDENFDSPESKDRKYLDKSVGGEKAQVSKYDDGVRYPVEKNLKVKDPSLEKLKGDDAPIEETDDTELDALAPDDAQEDEPELSDEIGDGSFEDQLDGGLADDSQPTDFDPVQISKGIKVEMEHTDNPMKALEITMDHLKEIPDYYDHLENMEGEAMEDNQECCGDNSEESLLDPSSHWVDDYTPKNITDEDINYDSPLSNNTSAGEAGEETAVEMDKLRSGELENEEEPVNKKKAEYDKKNKQLAPNWRDFDKNEVMRIKNSTPKGYKVEIRKVVPSNEKLWFQSLPSSDQSDVSDVISSPVDLQNWKNKFISKFGEEGILEKGKSLEKYFDVIGNDKYDQWKKQGMEDKSKYFSNESSMNEEGNNADPSTIKYEYDQKGNWIPKGYEDKRVALRSFEKPIGSDNWKVGVITLNQNGDMDKVIALKDDWGAAKNILHDSIK